MATLSKAVQQDACLDYRCGILVTNGFSAVNRKPARSGKCSLIVFALQTQFYASNSGYVVYPDDLSCSSLIKYDHVMLIRNPQVLVVGILPIAGLSVARPVNRI